MAVRISDISILYFIQICLIKSVEKDILIII